MAEYLPTHLELLPDDSGNTDLICFSNNGAHLGAENAQLYCTLEQDVEIRYRLHYLHAILQSSQPLIDLQERDHAAIFPQISGNRLALGFSVHGPLKENG